MNYWDRLRAFSVLYEKVTEPVRERYHLTRMEFDILMFLHNNPLYTTASDIVRVRRLTKSHVSASAASLEEKGLLEGRYAEGNRKSIRLRLTPAAAEIVTEGKKAQADYGEALLRGFTEAEREQFKAMFLRTCANADAELERRK